MYFDTTIIDFVISTLCYCL